jgi:hypothetical protein
MSNPELIGTWRWVSIDDRRIDQPFYARYYPNGKAATWPAPRSWSDSKGVSRGRYTVTNGTLVLKTDRGQDDPKTRIQIRGSGMTLTTDENHRLGYRRVVPNIEPGRLETGAPAGVLQNPM